MNWYYSPWCRSYESPQAWVDDAVKFDEAREGTQFEIRDVAEARVRRFKVEKGKAVALPE